jgi:hypothetical protein
MGERTPGLAAAVVAMLGAAAAAAAGTACTVDVGTPSTKHNKTDKISEIRCSIL